MPLGKLSANNIKKGMTQLNKISKLIGAKGTKKYKKSDLDELCEEFYSYIPHDFGFQKMYKFVLDTPKKVKNKVLMLQSLADIQIANSILESNEDSANMLDANYNKLKCDILPLDHDSHEYKICEKYPHTVNNERGNRSYISSSDLHDTIFIYF